MHVSYVCMYVCTYVCTHVRTRDEFLYKMKVLIVDIS